MDVSFSQKNMADKPYTQPRQNGIFSESKKTDRLSLPLNHSDFHILLALVDEERHGYGIMKEVESLSGGVVRLGPGTLYGSIKRLLEARYIEESTRRPDEASHDERRRCYYRLTGAGREAVQNEVRRIEKRNHRTHEQQAKTSSLEQPTL